MTDLSVKNLAERLVNEPGAFDPVTAFRIAESTGHGSDIASHIGVSLVVHPVSAYDETGDGSILVRTSLGAFSGPLGSLPPVYNEAAMKEARNHAHAFSAFLNIFNARLAQLFVASCEKYKLARLLQWHRCKDNSFLKALLSLAGFGTPHLIEKSGMHQNVLLHYSGFWAARTRNTVNLEAILRDFTGLPIEIEQFRPCWLPISTSEQSQPGRARASLGMDCNLGNRVLDHNSHFRVIIGPLNYEDYLSMSPSGQRLKELLSIVKNYAGEWLEPDFQIVLKKECIPFSRICARDPPRLGWNGWARTSPAIHDCTDSIVTSTAVLKIKINKQ